MGHEAVHAPVALATEPGASPSIAELETLVEPVHVPAAAIIAEPEKATADVDPFADFSLAVEPAASPSIAELEAAVEPVHAPAATIIAEPEKADFSLESSAANGSAV